MTDKLNYTSEDWKSAVKEEFTVDPQTVAEIEELVATLHRRCEAENIPFYAVYLLGRDANNSSVASSQVLPITRTPAELLAMATIGREGLGSGIGVIKALGGGDPLEELLGALLGGRQVDPDDE